MDNELGWQLSWLAIILTIIPFGQTKLYIGPLNVFAKLITSKQTIKFYVGPLTIMLPHAMALTK
jgi:hypothetical protein